MTPERAAVERHIADLVCSFHDLSRAMELLERRALLAEAENRELRERVDDDEPR